MTYEEWKKQREERAGTSGSKSDDDYTNWLVKSGRLGEDINELVNGWIKKNNSFYAAYNERIGRYQNKNVTDWAYESDSSNWLSALTTQKGELENEAEGIKSWLDRYKGVLSEDYYNSVMSTLDGNIGKYGGIISQATDINKHWSQWETEDAYKEWVTQQNDYDELLNFDLEAGRIELEDKRATYEQYATEYYSWLNTISQSKIELGQIESKLNKSFGLTSQERRELEQRKAELESLISQGEDYISKIDLGTPKQTISDLEVRITNAERIQNAHKLASVAVPESEYYDPEFEQYAAQGEAKGLETHKAVLGTNGAIVVAGSDVNNYIIAFRQNRDENGVPLASYAGAATSGGGGIDSRAEKFARYMSDEQYKTYTYYYGKYGDEKANEYLESIEEEINAKEAGFIFGNIEGNIVLEYAFGVTAGLDQFISGVEGMFADGYTPTSSIQMASGMVREDLAGDDDGFKIFGSSLGQVGYDIITTTSNMLPSILTSSAIGMVSPTAGAVVGAGLLGASAGGNAKAEMLNLGYSMGQANAYGAMVAIAEAGMEYLLGGISKLGGKASGGLTNMILSKVDNALARTAIKIGSSMVSEGFEEGLQTVIETWLKEIATGVDWDDPNIDEVLYSSLLGALSAFGLEGAGVVAGEVNTYKQGKNIQNVYAGVEKLQNIGTTFSADTVAYKIASKVNAQTDAYTIGRLLNEVGGSISEQNVTDIAKGLIAKGIDPQTANKLAKQYQAILNNEMHLTDEGVKILKNLSPLADVLRTNIIGSNTTVYQRTRAYSDLMSLADEVANGKKSKTTRLSNENILAKAAALFDMDEVAERSLMVSYATDLRNSEDGKIADPEVYAAAYNRVYSAGKKGADVSKIIGNVSSILSDSAIAQAYRAGEMAASAAAKSSAQDNAKAAPKATTSKGDLLGSLEIGKIDAKKSYYKLDDLGISKADQAAWVEAGIAQERNIRGEKIATVNTTVLQDELKRREKSSAKVLQKDGESIAVKEEGSKTISTAEVENSQAKENAIEPERVVYSSKTAKAYDAMPKDKLGKEQKRVVDVGAQIGRKVIFATTVNGSGVEVDGFISQNGDIYINPNKNVAPMAFVFKHELAHFAQRAGQKYRDFSNAVIQSATFKQWLKDKGFRSMQANNTQLREERAAVGESLDEPGANREIIANFVGEMLFGDGNTLTEDLIRELQPKQRKSVREYIREFFSWIKGKFAGDAGKAAFEVRRLEKMFANAYQDAVNNSQAKMAEEQFSIQEITGTSGTNYGIGVYLDSTLLSNLSDEERIEMVKERIKELGGKSFTAHDSNGNAVEIHIVESKKKYKNAQGKKVPVNRHLTNYTKSQIKQEALVLADELIGTASHQSSNPANHPHDWLDNNGTNDWEKWTVFIQDKENTVWEATLQIANSANGDKILYEIHPIKMVEGAAKYSASSTTVAEQSISLDTSTANNSISNSEEKNNSKNAQNFAEQTEQFSYTPQNDKVADVFERIRSGELSINDAEKLLVKPEGDNPATIASLKKEEMGSTPKINKKTNGNVGGGDSKFAYSVQRSSIFNEEFKKEVGEDSFVKHYAAITNKETLAEAAKRLDQGGEAYVTEWLSKKAVHMDTVDTVVGFILLKRYQDVGNYEGATAVAQKVRDVGTLSGQRVQAFSILGRFDADMMQAYAQKELDRAWELAIEGRSDKWLEKHKEQFKLTDEDISFIRDNIMYAAQMPENSRERAIALAQITTLIQSKIPPVRGQSFKAWQRVSMLLNPRTQLRNVAGNAMMAPVFVASDWFSTPLDLLISKSTGVRTTGLTGLHGSKANLNAMGKGFAESYDDWKRHINTKADEQNRFEIGQGKSFDETKWGRIAKIMNSFDRFNSFLLDAGDRPFYEMWFINSLNEQMRLNNVSEPTEAMVQIAVDEALSRTWQDENRMTKLVTGIKKAANQISISGYGMGDVLIKFTKTPANLTKAIYDFSPAAIVTITPQAIRLTKAIKNGTVTPSMQKKFVSSFGKMAAGTMLYVIFAALYAAGHIKGSSDEDKDVAAFEKYVQGIPEYSIKIGDKWFSYDWAQPIGSVPASIADYMESRKEGSTAIDSVLNAFKAGGEVLFNQSFMTSFKTLFSADSFSEGVLDIILGEVSVPVPTIFSQLANVLDSKRRVTYDGTSEFKSALNRAMLKIPGLRNLLEAEVDVLGREVDNSQKSWFNAFLNPANVYTDNSTTVTDHAYEIYQSTGDAAAIPPKAPYSVTLQGTTVKLDDVQRAQYQRAMGETASDLIEILLDNDVYKAMNDEEKLSVLKQVYSYAATVAKGQLEWADDYEVISGIAPYITKKDFDAMSYEERYQIVDNYIFSDYDGMQDIESEVGQSNFMINKKTSNLVLSATLAGDIDEAVKLIEGIDERVESYGWSKADTAEEIKERKTSVKSTLTRYWKQAYLYAYYKKDTEEQNRILEMLTKIGLYGDKNDVKGKFAEWVEAYEEENQ